MKRLQNRVIQHLQGSWWVYIFLGICFTAGIIFGALGVNIMDDQQTSSLRQFLDEGFSQFEYNLNFMATTQQAISKNLVNLGKIFLLGLTVIGFPLILVIIFTRGFVLGFTVFFLIKEKALWGALIALLAVFPPNFLSLPAYILAAAAAINFSLYLLRTKTTPIANYALSYLLLMITLAVLMLGAALIEGYLSPLFIQLLSFSLWESFVS
ncbi:MAG: stage II sporulation protein M [Firmicutes bacterium HGW-Firmicutes-12]|nr:MAG: stage II sporulation protein M [Firmicutes bacterium HGW-Firmicutes-12]